MNKKIIVPIIIVVLIVLGIFIGYLSDNPDLVDNVGRESFNVSSDGPYSLSKLTKEIKNNPYFDGYDKETLKWMESLGNKSVFSSSDAYVIVDNREAGKIPSQFVTDVFIYEHFTADVVENHSLIMGDHSRDVFYVKNIEYQGEEIQNLGLA